MARPFRWGTARGFTAVNGSNGLFSETPDFAPKSLFDALCVLYRQCVFDGHGFVRPSCGRVARGERVKFGTSMRSQVVAETLASSAVLSRTFEFDLAARCFWPLATGYQRVAACCWPASAGRLFSGLRPIKIRRIEIVLTRNAHQGE